MRPRHCADPLPGLVGLLNSESLAKNGKPLGFLNPLLYTMAKAKPATFIDVTTGSNACTEDGCASSCEGRPLVHDFGVLYDTNV